MTYLLIAFALMWAPFTYAATPASVGVLEFANDNLLFVGDSVQFPVVAFESQTNLLSDDTQNYRNICGPKRLAVLKSAKTTCS